MKVIETVITAESIAKVIAENGGVTIKNNKMVTYASGWQVADFGYVVTTIEECYEIVKQFGFTDCGIWYSDEQGGYCIDHSIRVKTKKQAILIGIEHNQESILKWSDMTYWGMDGKQIIY